MRDSEYWTQYKADLLEVMSTASPEALLICRSWHGENFGVPGNGGVLFVSSQIWRAEQAVQALRGNDQ